MKILPIRFNITCSILTNILNLQKRVFKFNLSLSLHITTISNIRQYSSTLPEQLGDVARPRLWPRLSRRRSLGQSLGGLGLRAGRNGSEPRTRRLCIGGQCPWRPGPGESFVQVRVICCAVLDMRLYYPICIHIKENIISYT